MHCDNNMIIGMFWEGHPSTMEPRKVPLEDYSLFTRSLPFSHGL